MLIQSLDQRPRVSTEHDVCTVRDEQGRTARFPRFQHSPLPSGRNIRLLKLQTEKPLWPLSSLSKANEFSLQVHELDSTDVAHLSVSKSPYVAMSYYWGEPIYDAPLFITDQGQRRVLPITSSAWEAIQRVPPAVGRSGKLFWIDQVCINQEDRAERAKQVELMGEIYRRCWHCMVWLGSADDNTRAAFELMQDLEKTFPYTGPMPLDEHSVAHLSHYQIRAQLASEMGRDVLLPPTNPGWVEVARLLQRDWFSRLWTFQEAVLCYKGDATIVCGKHHIEIVTFMRASMLLGNDNTFVGSVRFGNGRETFAQISKFRFMVEIRKLTPLVWLLTTNSLRYCRDPQDRIYALLGLRNEDGPRYPVQVNYQRTAGELFVEVARKIIQSQKSIRICAEAPERTMEGGLANLPSWVPDWTTQSLSSTYELLATYDCYFKSSGGRQHVDDMQDTRILDVRGKEVDQVEAIIETEIPDALTENERRVALTGEVLPFLYMTMRSRYPHVQEAELACAIVRTITVGGYAGEKHFAKSGLPNDAWSKVVCANMLASILNPSASGTTSRPDIDSELWLQILSREALFCGNRKFALVHKRLLALVPKTTQRDDLIAVLHGSSLPFVLRRAGNARFKMIGICYVEGIMHGEAVSWIEGDTFRIS